MVSDIDELREYRKKLEGELPVQEPLTGSRVSLSPENQKFIDARVLDLRHQMNSRFEEAELEMVMAKAGVSHASSDLRTALDAVASCTKRHDCEGAAALGYRDVSSAYVFLQRTLGDLQSTGHVRSELISEIAGKVGYKFEEVVALLPEDDHVIPDDVD